MGLTDDKWQGISIQYAYSEARPHIEQQAVAQYADFGELCIEATETAVDSLPRLLISETSSGRPFFSTDVGASDLTDYLRWGTSEPILRFAVIDGPHLQSPMIVAIAMSPVRPVCKYEGMVIGETGKPGRNRLALLTPKLLDTLSDGGIYVGDLGGNRGFGLATWNVIRRHNEPIAGKYHYEVTLYRYYEGQSQFRLDGRIESKGEYRFSKDALDELGLHYRNLLSDSTDLRC